MLDLLAVGGAHIDRTARMIAPHIMGASNPAHISETVGGGAFNAARNAQMLEITQVGMMSVRGGDAAGQAVEEAIERAGLADLSGSFIDRNTPTYTAILDVDGELVTAFADMALYDYGFGRQVRRLEGRTRIAEAGHVLIDANLPEAAIDLATHYATGPCFAMCISPAKAVRLLPFLARFHTVFLNRRELAASTQETEIDRQMDALLSLGVRQAVITNGAAEILVIDRHNTVALKVPTMDKVVDVTGAGDALTGATIASMITNPDQALEICAIAGIAAAQLTLQTDGPVCESIDEQAFAAMVEKVANKQ